MAEMYSDGCSVEEMLEALPSRPEETVRMWYKIFQEKAPKPEWMHKFNITWDPDIM